ncbi:MAG: hypothetical protein ACYC6Q_09415 [Syntrophales bacterium]
MMTRSFAPETERFLSRLEDDFRITIPDIREIISNFHTEMKRGLAGEQSSLRMIPTFVGRPTGKEKGDFLALDLGGTNLRVLQVALDGNGSACRGAAEMFAIPPALMGGDGERLFDFIADCVAKFFPKNERNVRRHCSLAFTFSFPVEQVSLVSGKLIGWTKGFTAAGVVGNDVVRLLGEALERKGIGFIDVTALTNDAAGTLAAGRYADSACDLGVILGTGTNACYPEAISRIGKLPGRAFSGGEMIINMEWGNFDRVAATRYDQILDGASENRGKQLFEKMVSGMYIGELARIIILEMIARGILCNGANPSALTIAYSLTAKQMAGAVQGGDFFADAGIPDASVADIAGAREICRIVSRRAARLAGTAIAAVVSWMNSALDELHVIAIDGSLFEKYPGFQEEMREALHELYGAQAARIAFKPAQDGSGLGAAIVAAVASSARN